MLGPEVLVKSIFGVSLFGLSKTNATLLEVRKRTYNWCFVCCCCCCCCCMRVSLVVKSIWFFGGVWFGTHKCVVVVVVVERTAVSFVLLALSVLLLSVGVSLLWLLCVCVSDSRSVSLLWSRRRGY